MKSCLQRVSKFLLLVLVAFVFLPPGISVASVDDFIIHSLDATYELSRDDPQGKLTITENIDLTFEDNNHGILRAIPDKYGDDDTNPKVISAMRDDAAEPFTTYSENNNLVLKIGNPALTITGSHKYELKYSVENVISFYDDHDELYWDVNGDLWLQNFESVTATVTTTEDLSFLESPEPVCYAGYFASRDQACELSASANQLIVSTTKELEQNQTLTFVAGFAKGYFVPVPLWQKLIMFIPGIIFVFAQIIIFTSAYRKWRKLGKDYPDSPVIAVAFGPPKDLGVLGSAYVYDDATVPKHISASIIDLAVRGYVRIIETDGGGILKKKTNRSLELLKPLNGLTSQEVTILSALFDTTEVGEVVDLDTKKTKLHAKIAELSQSLSAEMTNKGMYEVSPE